MAVPLYLGTKLLYRSTAGTALNRALPYAPYLTYIAAFPYREQRSIVFDQMLPKIAHYWPRATVEALLREAGLSDIKLNWVNEMSWLAIGTKLVADAAGR